ncbi:MAG: hypothetical protein IKK29_06195 [Christensenellaceae bacterium]|nr:hypothetical protein [Christensenellaceae bacterium]
MAFNYSISVKGNRVTVMLCECGKMIKKAYAYIKGEGGAKDIAQAVSYAARRLYIDTDWDDIPDDNTVLAIDEDELLKAIKTHDEEMKKNETERT